MTANANNSETGSPRAGGGCASERAHLKEGTTKVIIVETDDSSGISVTNGEQDTNEAISILKHHAQYKADAGAILDDVQQWSEQQPDVLKAYCYMLFDGINIEIVTKGEEHNFEIEDLMSEFNTQLMIAHPSTPVSFQSYAEAVYPGKGFPLSLN